jgi:hypothetical protein
MYVISKGMWAKNLMRVGEQEPVWAKHKKWTWSCLREEFLSKEKSERKELNNE